MSISEAVFPTETQEPAGTGQAPPAHQALRRVEEAFGVEFSLVDGRSGELVYSSPDQPGENEQVWAELCRQIAERGRPQFLAEEPPLVVLAVPLPEADGQVLVGVGTFVTHPTPAADDVTRAAQRLGLEPETAVGWAWRQTPWAPEALERVSRLATEQMSADVRIRELEEETDKLSVNLVATYEEISLLYRITQNLRISQSEEELGRVAIEWMQDVLPAEGLAIQLLSVAKEEECLTHRGRTESVTLGFGQCPIDDAQFARLVDHLDLGTRNRPTVVNPPATQDPTWPCPEVRQMIVAPLAEGANVFGWLAAFNHTSGEEFGTVEASLLSSVGAILGIHGGNIELYRQQSELLAGIVRALTSSIDAKDPYTCGHSDRVARVAVRLAQEIGCDQETVETIYLSGLLHDIGKIGIDDSVLRKPGKLTDEEYEHIKTHVRIGHRILVDLKKLDDVLPVVLYHHESWDGSGYPGRLTGEEIPLPARIVAVADAFDAMGSDRPYRKRMPDEKIDEIFHSGAGRQWDSQVVEAFFRAREDIRRIVQSDQDHGECDPHERT
ncbi:MAG TPA: HD-GYP domain-containing protein [Thermoguttaceae bacterium]|nr:HD-GYP domain-containing protein [Thermoguttaceae bacterium]